MHNSSRLVIAMAEKCRDMILQSDKVAPGTGLPKVLRPFHLLWMCYQIVEHAELGPETKLHRWIGFVQCGMIANRMLTFDEAKAMFADAKKEYGPGDEDLIDHLDPESSFKFEIGGEN